MTEVRRTRARHESHAWSPRSKVAVVLEMLRGADAVMLRERYDIALADLLAWRDRFLAGGEAYLSGSLSATPLEPANSLKRLVAVLEADANRSMASSLRPPQPDPARVRKHSRR